TAGQSVHCLSRILQRFPRDFQNYPLLRIHAYRLPRRDPEKSRIESLSLPQKPAPPATHLSRHCRPRIVVSPHIPPLRRHFAYRIHSLRKHFPKLFRPVAPARKSTSDSRNRNRFTQPQLTSLQLRLHLIESQ